MIKKLWYKLFGKKFVTQVQHSSGMIKEYSGREHTDKHDPNAQIITGCVTNYKEKIICDHWYETDYVDQRLMVTYLIQQCRHCGKWRKISI